MSVELKPPYHGLLLAGSNKGSLVGGTGHYLNRPAEFETSLLGLMRGYTPTVQRDRDDARPVFG